MTQPVQASLFPAKRSSVQGPWSLPSGWEWVPLDQVLNIQNGCAFDSNLFSTKVGFPLVRIRDLCTGEPSIFYNGLFDPRFIVKPGDCLIGMDGEFRCYQWSGPEALLNQRVCRLIDFHKNVDPAYVCYGLNQFLKRIEDTTPFVTVKHISAKQIKGICFPFPPSFNIQRQIVARIEALLAELKEARSLTAAIRRDTDRIMDAALEEVFGKIRQGFEVTGIPKSQIKPIEKVAQLERGKFSYRPRNERRFFGGAIPWVQIQNIPRDYNKYITDYMDTLNEDGLAISKLFPKGTLVVSIAATIGAVGVLSFDACFPDSLVGITPDVSQIEPGFLYWQLCYLREHLETIAPAAAQKNVNLQILSRINLWVPPASEQQAIDTYLDTIQAEVEEMRRLQAQDAELLDQLEQSILERAFRGEL